MLGVPKGWKKLHRTGALWFPCQCLLGTSVTLTANILPFSSFLLGSSCFSAFQGLVGKHRRELRVVVYLIYSGHTFNCWPCSSYLTMRVGMHLWALLECRKCGISEFAHLDEAHPWPCPLFSPKQQNIRKDFRKYDVVRRTWWQDKPHAFPVFNLKV